MFTIVDMYLIGTNFEMHREELLNRAKTERLVRQAVQPDFIPASQPVSGSNSKHDNRRLFQPLSRFMKQFS